MKANIKYIELMILIFSLVFVLFSVLNMVFQIPEKFLLTCSVVALAVSIVDIFDSLLSMKRSISSREKEIVDTQKKLTQIQKNSELERYMQSLQTTAKTPSDFQSALFKGKLIFATLTVIIVFFAATSLTDSMPIHSQTINTCSLFTSAIAFLGIALKSNVEIRLRQMDSNQKEILSKLEQIYNHRGESEL